MSKPRPSMEFLFPTSFRTPRHFSLCSPFKLAINGRFSCRSRFRRRWDRVAKRPLRVALALERGFSFGEDRNAACARGEAGFCEDSECLEVIGIGSRRDAVLDFCLDSPFQSTSLRFWNILQEDSSKVILQQRFLGKDITPRVVEAPLSLRSCSKAIILVAGAAYGSDHITAIEIVKRTRTAKGLAVAIVLKPFSFEGQRRQDEVMYMVGKLQEHTNFYIVIDMDRLLQKDLVTLDEALRTAKNAVLLSLNAIAVLISRKHQKFIDVPHDNMKELEISHIIDIMECYTEAKVGFGVGYSIKSSIVQAVYDCPFLSVGIKDLNGTIICVLASSGVINSTDVNAFLQTFRQTTNCSGEIVISTIEEPNLEPNLIISTVFILGCIGQPASQKRNIFARLAHHFPFVVNFLGKNDQETKRTQGNHYRENSYVSNKTSLSDSVEMPKSFFEGGRAEGFTCCEEHQEPQTLSSSNNSQVDALRSNVGFSEDQYESSNFYDRNIEAFQREPLISWNLGPGHQIAQEWAKERETNADSTPVLDNPTFCPLPVGVRQSEELKDGSDLSNTTKHLKQISGDDMTAQSLVTPRASPRNTLTDFSFEAVFDFCNSMLLKKNYPDALKKQRVLSARAASMLEAERDSGKRWSPIAEIEYRGGVYRGRCQGGVPEGKGRLSLGDGSIYDGMWRSGQRAGLGIFYYSNGDVFQGSWRDDVVHGKGWFYFHSGDRWFANFWKGKANGEGRFYSKAGDVFFGHFQDGWRHGRFLCINVDGVRFVEIWDGGVLVSRKQLDLDAKSGEDVIFCASKDQFPQ